MSALERAERRVESTRARLGAVLALRATVRALAGWTAAWGVLLVGLRAGLGTAGPGLLVCGVGALVPGALAAGWGWRRRPGVDLVRAHLDARERCGGLVLAARETDLGAWADRVPPLTTPRLRWRAGRALASLATAGAFTAGAMLLPVSGLRSSTALDVSRPAAQLASRLDLLAALDEHPAQGWREELGKATDLAAAGETERAWQALDALQASLDEAQRGAADAALAEADRLQRAAARAAAAADPHQSPTGAASAPTAGGSGASAKLDNGSSTLDAGTRAALAADLRHAAGEERRLASALQGGGAVDLDALRRRGGLDERALADLLAHRAGGESGGGSDENLGRGGVDRGRGDAPFTVKEPSNNWGIGFVDQSLPPAAVGGLEASVVLSTDAARPLGATGAASAPGALAGATAAGGAAFTELVLPRHRAAVRRYFVRLPEP